MMSDTKRAHDFLVTEELGINAEELKGSAVEAAMYSVILFSNGTVIPLVTLMFTSGNLSHGLIVVSN